MTAGNTVITFDLWCNYTGKPPAYRIYVDDHLMTERNYICKNPNYYIQETVPVYVDVGLHYLKIVSLDNTAQFEIRNFQVSGTPAELKGDIGKFYIAA